MRRDCASRARRALLLFALSVAACTEDAEPTARPVDAGGPAVLASTEHGFRLPLLSGWVIVPSAPSAPPVRRVAAARRTAGRGASFEVAPRIDVSVEPTIARSPEAAFQLVKADVEGLDHLPGATLIRSSMGFRPVGPELVGDLNVRYRVGGDDGREVRQRSLLVWRRDQAGDARVLSLTATYLARDLDIIEPEVQRMFAALQLSAPERAGPVPTVRSPSDSAPATTP